MKRLWVPAVVLALIAAVTVWFVDRGGIFPTKEIRYRYEVTLQTPDGQMSGYSVHRLVIQDTTMTPARNYQVDLDGEAVPFELSDGRVIFATLRPEGGVGLLQLFGGTVGFSGTGKWIDVPEHFDALVRSSNWPSLAIIENPSEPESLRWVEGKSEFRVVGARMISTDEQMTEGVTELLPWLVEAIAGVPYSSRKTTEHHKIVSALKFGVLR